MYKPLIIITIVLQLANLSIAQNNVEFKKSNFEDRKEEFKSILEKIK